MVLISHRNKNHVSYKSDTCQKDLKKYEYQSLPTHLQTLIDCEYIRD